MSSKQAYIEVQRFTYAQAMKQGREFEQMAEKYRLDAEGAYADVAAMKSEGRSRVRVGRMLPDSEATADFRTSQFKAVADAKGDVTLWLSWAENYAALAQMKYAKAAAIMAEILTWQNQ